MRIAQVMHGWPAKNMGGTGLYVEALSRALAELGHEVAIVYPSQSKVKKVDIEGGLSIHGIPVPPPRRWRETWDGPSNPWTNWCADWAPDVVHFHHLSGFPLGIIAATPCRKILTLHDYAIPCARGQLMTDTLDPCSGPTPLDCTRCLGPALSAGPLMTTAGRMLAQVPGVYRWAKARVSPSHVKPHAAVTDRIAEAHRAISAADQVLSPSRDLARRMATMGFTDIGHTALPMVQDIPRRSAPRPGPVRFLFASTIIPTKGPDRLVRTFRKLNAEAQLTIAGHSPEFPTHPGFSTALQADAAKDSRIAWIGPVPASEMGELLARHDVLVLPSRWPENSPLIIREATSAGLRVIASAEGGARELAPDGDFIETDEELLAALERACSAGRTRPPSADWPSPCDHARTLLREAYKGNGRTVN